MSLEFVICFDVDAASRTDSQPSKLTAGVLLPGVADRLYSMNFKGPLFNQVFYPTRGILVWYAVTVVGSA
jgi:hypothetical protein